MSFAKRDSSVKKEEIRSLAAQDIDEMLLMAESELERSLDREKIKKALDDFPSAALRKEGDLIGFAYCISFAPDVLQLANILIDHRFRSQGFGEMILRKIEDEACDKYKAIVLVNSSLYPNPEGKKRSAQGFYEKLGYNIIASTDHSNIFFKLLENQQGKQEQKHP